jgi:hypothetical protein
MLPPVSNHLLLSRDDKLDRRAIDPPSFVAIDDRVGFPRALCMSGVRSAWWTAAMTMA